MNTVTLQVQIREKIRLDKYLSDQLTDISRTRIQQQIKSGNVTVDGQPVKASYQLEGGEEIYVVLIDNQPEPAAVIPQQMDLDIIYEDDALAVINKPAGLVVHPGKGNREDTLANGLAYHFRNLSDVNGVLRPGLVHRLDKDTTGLIIIAKTNQAHLKLARLFEQREIEKTYLGITWGEWDSRKGRIEIGIRRQRSDPTRFEASNDGKPAITDYEVIDTFRHLSYVQFYPRTGRTHQIRVHSAHSGFAIFADIVYNGGVNRTKGYLPEVRKFLQGLLDKINRHALHAFRIRFKHPNSGEDIQFEAPLPPDMTYLLSEIKLFNG